MATALWKWSEDAPTEWQPNYSDTSICFNIAWIGLFCGKQRNHSWDQKEIITTSCLDKSNEDSSQGNLFGLDTSPIGNL